MASQKTNFKYKGVDLADIIEIETFTRPIDGKYNFTHKTGTSDFKKYASNIYYYINNEDIGQKALISPSLISSYAATGTPVAIPTNATKVRYYMRSGSGGGGGGGGHVAVNSNGQENYGGFGGTGGGSGLIGGEFAIPADATIYNAIIGTGGPGGSAGSPYVNENWSPGQKFRDSGAGTKGDPGGFTRLILFNSGGGMVSDVSLNGGTGGSGGIGVRINSGTTSNQIVGDELVQGTDGSAGPRSAPATWTEIANTNGGPRGTRGWSQGTYPGGNGSDGYMMLVWLN